MDRKRLREFIESLRNLPLERYPERQIEQVVVAPLLELLDWAIRDPDEVVWEYSAGGGGRVDYALCQNAKPLVYIEAKNGGESLSRHTEQLIQYAFRTTVDIVVLTNGADWQFYLPREDRNWQERLFWSPNLKTDDIDSICGGFVQYLNKENVLSRKAVEAARERLRGADIQEAMREAWNTLIEEPDPALLDLIAQVTERKCQRKADLEKVRTFIAENKEGLLLRKPPGDGGGGGDDSEPDDNKAWYYWEDKKGRRYILAFVNALKACSMRRFDAETGKFLGKPPNPKGNYQDNFAEYIRPEWRLDLSDPPNLTEACKKKRLPDSVLSELRSQIQDIRQSDRDR
jgi:predicted type IV restriction endonuclease